MKISTQLKSIKNAYIMKNYCFILGLLLLSCFTSLNAQTQKLPLQGKLLQNDQPVTGSRNFRFAITSLNWSQSVPNVAIVGGLYNVILDVPSNTFSTQDNQDLRIELDGSLLETVKIYAPLERDPSVPANLRDGVSWDEVTNKPSNLDQDDKNELQMLSIKGDTLFLSKGNFVVLPVKGGGGSATADTLKVNAPANGAVAMIQPTKKTSSLVASSWVGQTFRASMNGNLHSVGVRMSNPSGAPFKVSFYESIPDGSGIRLATVSINNGSAYLKNDLYVFSFEDQTVDIKTVGVYEIRIESNGGVFDIGTNFALGWLLTGPNYSPDLTKDLLFAIYITPIGISVPGASLKVTSDGSVGIGTDNPTAKLEVKGRIKDQSGYLTPVGTIIAYAGPFEPEGWLFCDGREVKIADYPELFAAIDAIWGGGSQPFTFKIPDLRGLFLRSVDAGSGRDPDASTRTPAGDRVGSMQGDDFKSHNHRPFDVPVLQNYWINPVPDSGIIAPTRGSKATVDNVGPTGSTGGKETRPKNAAVHYYIKY
jgi:microcystin-dependent protein